jgi:hypothetical protein
MLRCPQCAQKASTCVDPQFRQAAGRGRVSGLEGTGRGLLDLGGQVTSRAASTGPLP